MHNIFTYKYKSKDVESLVDILLNKDRFEREAVEAAILELRQREVFAEIPSNEKLREIKNHLKTQRKTQIKEDFKTEIKKKVAEPNFWGWLPNQHIIDLTGYYSFIIIVYFLYSYPYEEDIFNDIWLYTIVLIIPLWQGNIISSKHIKRSIHFHQRLIFSFAFTFIAVLRKYLAHGISFDLEVIGVALGIYVLFLLGSGFPSFFFYVIKIPKLSTNRWYFIQRFRVFIPITVLLILVSIVLQKGLFIKDKTIYWQNETPITFDDFRGYTNFFTAYDGAIKSYIEYKFDDNEKVSFVQAACNTKSTWVNFWDTDSYLLLQHERYHFNVTEVVTRMAKKEIMNLKGYESNASEVQKILREHEQILRVMQNKYDTESDHSLIRDVQAYWQFNIDSMLFELDAYGPSTIMSEVVSDSSVNFFRKIRLSSKNGIVGLYRLMPGEEHYTNHYRISVDKVNNRTRAEHYSNGQHSKDQTYGSAAIEVVNHGDYEEILFFDKEDNLARNNNGYAIHRTKTTNKKAVITHFDENRSRCANSTGTFLIRYTLDSLERKVQAIKYDSTNNILTINESPYKTVYGYEGISRFISSKKYFGFNNQPLLDEYQVHEIRYEHDSLGNQVYEGKLDLNGQFVLNDGFAQKKRKYNELGQYIELTFLDESGNLCEVNDRNARITWSYDRYGYQNRESFYNGNNVLVGDQDDIASTYQKFDVSGNAIGLAQYGTGDNLSFDANGYGKVTYKYDSNSYLIEVKNLDGYDVLVRGDYAVPITRMIWDSTYRTRTIKYFDENYQPDTLGTGEAWLTQNFDENNNTIETNYYDLDDNLIAVKEDVATFKFAYDEYGNKTESRFYNINGNLATANQGVSINTYLYSGKDRMIQRSYYDSLENLAPFDGKARIKLKLDRDGNKIEERYFDKNNTLLDSGVAVISREFDTHSRPITVRKFNHQNQPITTKPAIIKYQYNTAGEKLVEAYFDDKKQPTVDDEGVHRYQYYYDDKNYYLGCEYFDRQGKLTEISGIAKIEFERDSRGNATTKTFFDINRQLAPNEQGVAKYNWKYDLYDRYTYEAYHGPNGLPMLLDSTHHINKYIMDRAGNVTHKSYHDVNGELTINDDSIALYVNTYDRNGGYTYRQYDIPNAIKILDGLKEE